jgi:hypothetical protein
VKQTIPPKKEESNIDLNVVFENDPSSKTFDGQVSSSPQLFLDLPISIVIPRKVIATPRVTTSKSLKMSRAPLGLIDFPCVITIDEPLMWEEVIEKQDDDKWKKATNKNYCTLMKNETWILLSYLNERKQ